MPQLFPRLSPTAWLRHLAYVEWFTKFTTPHPDHGLYKVSRSTRHNSYLDKVVQLGEILTVDDLECSCHLIPDFGRIANREWTSSDVLEQCTSFYVNAYTDRNTYKLIL